MNVIQYQHPAAAYVADHGGALGHRRGDLAPGASEAVVSEHAIELHDSRSLEQLARSPVVAHGSLERSDVSAEIVWALPVMHRRPSSSALAAAVRRETELDSATLLVEREARRITESALALVVIFDGAQRSAWTPRGYALTPEVIRLVSLVASAGERAISAHTIVEPFGPAPSRAVLVLRRDGRSYRDGDYAAVHSLVEAVAPSLEPLIP